MNVIEYCTEEVERQGHDTTTLDGIERVGWMLDAWSYAIKKSHLSPTKKHIETLGALIERKKNAKGFRKIHVYVGQKQMVAPEMVDVALDDLFANPPHHPFEFYRELLHIHPFEDGNGRTGKVVLNWVNNSLYGPVFPPNDFWGKPIRNP